MKSVSGAKRANESADDPRFRMCGRCRAAILPNDVGSSLRSDMLRAPADGMVKANDPRAVRIKRRKEAKQLRSISRTEGIVSAAKFFLQTPVAAPVSEECEDCLALRSAPAPRRARLIGYDPTTHSAYVREIPA